VKEIDRQELFVGREILEERQTAMGRARIVVVFFLLSFTRSALGQELVPALDIWKNNGH
jgi:hypothetical protein